MNIRSICSGAIRCRAIGAMLALATFAAPALAGLGAAPTPVLTPAGEDAAASGARSKSMHRVPEFDGYTINEIHTAAGGVIAEYVSTAGVVFGISWRGPAMPDLRALLGTYFPTFEQAAIASRAAGRRGPLSIDSADLVLQSGGHMRDYQGRAYVPGLLPPNVPAAAIQ